MFTFEELLTDVAKKACEKADRAIENSTRGTVIDGSPLFLNPKPEYSEKDKTEIRQAFVERAIATLRHSLVARALSE